MKWGLLGLLFFAALPATTNYQLNSYGFGTGGTANSGTATYSLEGTTGEVSGANASTTTYSLKPGFTETQQAHVPKFAFLYNGAGTYYNKLDFIIDTQSNPSDALYAISASTDNFVSDFEYVKSDMTLGTTLTLADYQTYAGFGGAAGSSFIGLKPNTTYWFRIKATQGKYTESPWSKPVANATVGPQLSFSMSTNSVAMGSLLASTVITGSPPVTVTFATNAASGGDVYISGQNGGLASVRTGTTITSSSVDLGSASRGFGAQVSSISAASGSFSKVSPYDLGTNNVGIMNSVIRRIMTSPGPLAGGSGSVSFKAKSAPSDPAANDYTELSTMLASANF